MLRQAARSARRAASAAAKRNVRSITTATSRSMMPQVAGRAMVSHSSL